jgi:hypothetical protein
MSDLLSTNMPDLLSRNITDGPRLGGPPRIYDKPERKLIDQHKARYMNATSPSERRTIAITDIFPKLFNYWADLGKVLSDEEETIKTNVSKK